MQLPVEVGGITLRVRVWPASQASHVPVVLLPATAETADDWDLVASALSASRTVYAINLRGHGGSNWPGDYSIRSLAGDVCGLLDELGERAVDLVGHSLGGLVACRVASTRAALLRRLVLEDVGLLHPRRAAFPARPEGDLPFDWRVVEQVRPEIDDPDPHWDRIIAAVEVPTLVIAGGPRSHVPQRHVAELVHLLPNGAIVTLDTGHLVHATQPTEFVEQLQTFLH